MSEQKKNTFFVNGDLAQRVKILFGCKPAENRLKQPEKTFSTSFESWWVVSADRKINLFLAFLGGFLCY